jgi:hypothetical protein
MIVLPRDQKYGRGKRTIRPKPLQRTRRTVTVLPERYLTAFLAVSERNGVRLKLLLFMLHHLAPGAPLSQRPAPFSIGATYYQ